MPDLVGKCDQCDHLEKDGRCFAGVPATDSHAYDRALEDDRRGKDACEWGTEKKDKGPDKDSDHEG